MNRLPPGRPGVSSCSISDRARAARPALSLFTTMLLLRASATSITRCDGSAGTPAADGASVVTRVTIAAMSSAEACFTGTTTVSALEGWSSEATMRSMRRRLDA